MHMQAPDWYLYFRQTRPTVIEGFALTSEPILLAEYVQALAAAARAPVTTTAASYSGNPRDFYSREVTLTATCEERIQVELRAQQSALGPDDPAPILGDTLQVVLRAPLASYAAKLATWCALRDELAKVGCVDRTAELKPTAIVDEARAAGDAETATRLAGEIAAVQEAERARAEHIESLRAERAELAAPAPAQPAKQAAPVAQPSVARGFEPRVTFHGGVLEVAYGTADAAALRALLEGGAYRDATKVVLVGSPIGDAGVALLARSGAFPRARELHLGATGLTDRGARALARQAVGLDHLERLDLGEVPGEGSPIGARANSGVSDAGVDEIARSPRLPALRRIERGKEHRFPGGREGRELVEISRADGRIVESSIYHSIWP